jgi:HK97 family phage portal protein
MAVISLASPWRWLARTFRFDAAGGTLALTDGNSEAGEFVSTEGALQLSAVWACVRLLSQTVASLPCEVFRVEGDTSVVDRESTLFGLLHNSPNLNMTAIEFFESLVACLGLWGNYYGEKSRNGGQVIAIQPLRPDLMTVELDDVGNVVYRYTEPRGSVRTIARDDIFHVKGFSIDGLVGLSPIAYARNSLGTALATERASGRVFRNGMRGSVALTVPREVVLDVAQRSQLREELAARYSGVANTGKPWLLPFGITATAIGMPPEDAQMLETRSFGVEEICRWFGVPPPLIGHSSAGTGWPASQEQQNAFFLTYGLRPYLKRIEQAVGKSLIAPGERGTRYAKFNFDALMRADSAARAAYYATMTQNGIMTRNEIRAKENLESMDGGDALTVQSNLVPIDKLGQMPPANLQQRATDQPTAEPIKQ